MLHDRIGEWDNDRIGEWDNSRGQSIIRPPTVLVNETSRPLLRRNKT